MTKRYATLYTNGHTIETSRGYEAKNIANLEEGQKFFLRGLEVTAEVFYGAAADEVQAAWDRKLETHRRATTTHGSSVLCRTEKWVRR